MDAKSATGPVRSCTPEHGTEAEVLDSYAILKKLGEFRRTSSGRLTGGGSSIARVPVLG